MNVFNTFGIISKILRVFHGNQSASSIIGHDKGYAKQKQKNWICIQFSRTQLPKLQEKDKEQSVEQGLLKSSSSISGSDLLSFFFIMKEQGFDSRKLRYVNEYCLCTKDV